jgi:hypothetical protein
MRSRIHRMPGLMPGKPLPKERSSSNRYRYIGIVLVVGGIISGLYWFFFLSPVFSIEKIEIIGSDNESVRAAADRLTGGNIFRLHATSLAQTLTQSYPPIETVTVVRGLPHVVRINITLRRPALRWQINDVIYIIDSEGEIFEQGDKPDYADLPKIVDKSGLATDIGQTIVTPEFIQFVTDMQKRIPTLFTQAYLGNEISETTFHIDALLQGDIRIRLTAQRPLQEQLDAAKSILAKHPEAKIIDVRATRWGYWK